MSLQGKVISVSDSDSTAVISVTPKTDCKGCHACSGLLGNEQGPPTRQIKARVSGLQIAPGDEVIVDLNPGEGSVAAFLIFGMPMLGFFAGLFAAPQFCAFLGTEISDAWRIFSGFIGMSLAFALLALFSRSKHADRLSMRVITKVEANPESQQCHLSNR